MPHIFCLFVFKLFSSISSLLSLLTFFYLCVVIRERKKERKICQQRFVKGEKDARHAATRRHTHTHTERERDAERRKSRRLSLSSAKKQKNTQLITPLLQAPILSERTDPKRVALSSRSTNRNLPENERQTTTR